MSTKRVSSENIVGTDKSQRCDAIDFPAIKNPKNTQEIFDTSKYTDAHKKYGFSRIAMLLQT